MSEIWGTRIEDWDPKFFADSMCEYSRSGGYQFPFVKALMKKQEGCGMITDEMKMDAIQHFRDGIIGTRRVAHMLYREDELSQRSRLNSVFYAIKYDAEIGDRAHYQYVGVYFDMECTESEDGNPKVKFTKVDEYSYRLLHNKKIPHREENLDGMIATFDRRFARRRPRR